MESLETLKILRDNGIFTIGKLIQMRVYIDGLISQAKASHELLEFVEEPLTENHLFDSYSMSLAEILRNMLITNEELNDLISEHETSAIYALLCDGQDYEEALRTLAFAINPGAEEIPDPIIEDYTEEETDPGEMVSSFVYYYNEEHPGVTNSPGYYYDSYYSYEEEEEGYIWSWADIANDEEDFDPWAASYKDTDV